MRIFIAGGSGTIGVPLVRSLVRAGHQVTAATRSPQKEDMLRALGAAPVLVDALEAKAAAELDWHPRYPTIHEGLAQVLARAA